MDQIVETMGDRLRKARIAAGCRTASDGAKKVGLPLTTYTAHENGQNDYSPQQAEIYAAKFNTTAEWLLFARQAPPATSSPGIDEKIVQIRKLDEDASRKLIERFNAIIEGVKILLKTD